MTTGSTESHTQGTRAPMMSAIFSIPSSLRTSASLIFLPKVKLRKRNKLRSLWSASKPYTGVSISNSTLDCLNTTDLWLSLQSAFCIFGHKSRYDFLLVFLGFLEENSAQVVIH
jgi:hypothetical protein